MVQRLDPDTTKAWEHTLGSSRSPPSWSQFRDFMLSRLLSLQAIEKSQPQKPHSLKAHIVSSVADDAQFSKNNIQCSLCSEDHKIFQCAQCKLKSLDQKWNFVYDKKLCFNCLGFHISSKCQSNGRCVKCGKKHHTSLHEKFVGKPDSVNVNHVSSKSTHFPSTVFLATAQIYVLNDQ